MLKDYERHFLEKLEGKLSTYSTDDSPSKKKDKKSRAISNIVFMFAFCIILPILLCSPDLIERLANKDDYMRVEGTIIEIGTKEDKSYGRRGSSTHYTDYLSVEYEYMYQTRVAHYLTRNFWEDVGDTIDFYVTPAGIATRGTLTCTDYNILYIIFGIFFFCKELWTNRHILFESQFKPVVTVLDAYDFSFTDSPSDPSRIPMKDPLLDPYVNPLLDPALVLTQTDEPDPQNDIYPNTFTTPPVNSETPKCNVPNYSAPQNDTSESTIDFHQPKVEESIPIAPPIIQIPDEYSNSYIDSVK